MGDEPGRHQAHSVTEPLDLARPVVGPELASMPAKVKQSRSEDVVPAQLRGNAKTASVVWTSAKVSASDASEAWCSTA